MDGLTPDEEALLQAYRASNKEDKEWLLDVAKASARDYALQNPGLRLVVNRTQIG